MTQGALAQSSGAGSQRVILTVTGAISPPDGGVPAQFTSDKLEQLGTVDLTTTTPFTHGDVHFTGVPLQKLLSTLGAHGATVHATALNDYSVDIPASDATSYPVLLATRIDGKPLPIRDKGPIWVVYPWSDHPELRNPTYESRSIWQVRSIDIR